MKTFKVITFQTKSPIGLPIDETKKTISEFQSKNLLEAYREVRNIITKNPKQFTNFELLPDHSGMIETLLKKRKSPEVVYNYSIGEQKLSDSKRLLWVVTE